MRYVVVLNTLSEAIHAAITAKLAGRPITEPDREQLYHQLLDYFDKTGKIPDFELASSKHDAKGGVE